MGHHSITETSLAEVIDLALAGEDVVVTRDGRPVAEIRVAREHKAPQPMTTADIDWLAERRKGIGGRSKLDAGEFVSRMRDEDWR